MKYYKLQLRRVGSIDIFRYLRIRFKMIRTKFNLAPKALWSIYQNRLETSNLYQALYLKEFHDKVHWNWIPLSRFCFIFLELRIIILIHSKVSVGIWTFAFLCNTNWLCKSASSLKRFSWVVTIVFKVCCAFLFSASAIIFLFFDWHWIYHNWCFI